VQVLLISGHHQVLERRRLMVRCSGFSDKQAYTPAARKMKKRKSWGGVKEVEG
jgi:hypothetical protein